MDGDGNHNKQITTNEAADFMPFISPDGQNIVFISNRSGQRNIWRMKINGSEQKQITDEENVFSFSLSTDGQNLYFTAPDKSTRFPVLRRISIDGGVVTQQTTIPTLLPQVSPDGKLIACYFAKTSNPVNFQKDFNLTVLSAEDGKVIRQFPTIEQDKLSPLIWSDDQHLNFVTNINSGSQLWQQSLDKETPILILDSPDERILRFAFSPDKKKIVYEKGNTINDLILIKSLEN
jgi:Tol biopolymer transport system component